MHRVVNPFVLLPLVATLLITAAYLGISHNRLTPTFPSFLSSPSTLPYTECADYCPSNPFVRPGMMYWGTNRSQTQYVPFPHEPENAKPIKISDLGLERETEMDRVPKEALEFGSIPFLRMLSRGESVGSRWDWARDRIVLFVGSSHDRNNVQQMCDEAANGATYTNWGGHTGGYCKMPILNLTIINWFTYGMVDDEQYSSLWLTKEQPPATIENRVEQIFIPKMREAGFSDDWKPDLLIFGSLFWDEHFLKWHRQHLSIPETGIHGFSYSEITWHRARIHALISLWRQMFGDDLPIMFRTRQFRKADREWSQLKIEQLDQSQRAVAKELNSASGREDIKLFNWGDLLEGYDVYYDKDQHFALGPSTYLACDMMMFYLLKTVMPSCWSCSESLTTSKIAAVWDGAPSADDDVESVELSVG